MSDFDKSNTGQTDIQEDHSDMMSVGYLIVLVLACIVLSLIGNGCSAIGYGVGSAIHKTEKHRFYEAAELRSGTEWVVILRDRTKLRGFYRGLDSISTQEYNDTYSQALDKNQPQAVLPYPGDRIEISDMAGSSEFCKFRYFDYSRFGSAIKNAKVETARNFVIRTDAIPGTKPLYFNLMDIKSVGWTNGARTKGDELATLATKGEIPLKTRFLYAIQDSVVAVPLQQISMIESPNKKDARWTGFGIGLAMDITGVIVIMVISSIDFSFDLSQGSW